MMAKNTPLISFVLFFLQAFPIQKKLPFSAMKKGSFFRYYFS
ncbi:hypothetical protein D932_01884 [Enterococcus casseliflavus 14-MB-W-14]|nr:hypothetical protein D932_01884 [Enterococcus casseliflavus 14-MB-W-14]